MSDWTDPTALADASVEDRRDAWRSLCRTPLAGAKLAAVQHALAAWPDVDRVAPPACFAVLDEREATGPHDPGASRFVALRETPGWPWPIARYA